jgi:TPR repeat protein
METGNEKMIYQWNSDLNNGTGCSDLGFMYKEGKGVKQDDFKALKFYQKACGLNFSGGCSNLQE